jgi:4-amino-4-deoxychorismate lyase
MRGVEVHSSELAARKDFYIFTSYLWENCGNAQHITHSENHYFLPYHRDRLVSAAQTFNWTDVLNLLQGDEGVKRISSVVDEHLMALCDAEQAPAQRKIKVCIYKSTRFHVESTAIALTDLINLSHLPVDLNQGVDRVRHCIVKLDVEPTISSPFTTHKTSERNVYDQARRAADIIYAPATTAEVLLFNPRNEILECSLSTPYFLRNGQWVTPSLSSGGNAGVTRRLAMESGLCEEQVILVESVRHDEAIWISNGVRGFIPAILHLRDPE